MKLKNMVKIEYLRKINRIHFALVWMFLILCSCRSFEKYNSDWMVYRFERYGIDETEKVIIQNFSINPELKRCTPPGVRVNGKLWSKEVNKIEFEHIDGKDYMTILDHSYFQSKYLVECLDNDCCRISVSNDSLYFELDYNFPDMIGEPRTCPPPRVE